MRCARLLRLRRRRITRQPEAALPPILAESIRQLLSVRELCDAAALDVREKADALFDEHVAQRFELLRSEEWQEVREILTRR